MIDFTIKTLDSNNHELSVPDEITIEELKEVIRVQLGIEPGSQRLIFCGRVLQDDKKLSEYKVQGKVVHLVQRAPPSPGSRQQGPPLSGTSRSESSGREQTRRNIVVHVHQAPSSPQWPRVSYISRDERLSREQMRRNTPLSERFEEEMVEEILTDLRREHQQAASLNAGEDRPLQSSSITARMDTIRRLIADIKRSISALRALDPSEQASTSGTQTEDESMDTDESPAPPPAETMEEDADENEEMAVLSPIQHFRRRPIRASRSRHNRPRDLAQLNEVLKALQEQFEPYLHHYTQILRDSGSSQPPEYEGEERDREQRRVDLVLDTMHTIAHTMHAISDISFQVGQRHPRLVAEPQRPPIPVQAHINVFQASPRRPTATASTAGSTATSAATAASTPNAANSVPSPNAANSVPSPNAANSVPSPNAVNSVPSPSAKNSVPSPSAANGIPTPSAANSAPIPSAVNAAPTPSAENSAPTLSAANPQQAQNEPASPSPASVSSNESESQSTGGTARNTAQPVPNPLSTLAQAINASAQNAAQVNEAQRQVLLDIQNQLLRGLRHEGGVEVVVRMEEYPPGGAGGNVAYEVPRASLNRPNDNRANVPHITIGSLAGLGIGANIGDVVGGNVNINTVTFGGLDAESGVVVSPLPFAGIAGVANADMLQNILATVLRHGLTPNAETQNASNQAQGQSQTPGQAQTQGQNQTQGEAPAAANASAPNINRSTEGRRRGRAVPQGGWRRALATARAQALTQVQNSIYDRFLHCESPHARRSLQRRSERREAGHSRSRHSLRNLIFDRFFSGPATRFPVEHRTNRAQAAAEEERTRVGAERGPDLPIELLMSRAPGVTQEHMGIIQTVLSSSTTHENWIPALMITMARELFLNEHIHPRTENEPADFLPLRRILRLYLNELVERAGVDVTELACTTTSDFIVGVHNPSVERIAAITPIRPNIDLLGSMRSLVRSRWPSIIAALTGTSRGDVSNCSRFYMSMTRAVVDICALIMHSSEQGMDGLRIVYDSFLEGCLSDFEPSMQRFITVMGNANFNVIASEMSTVLLSVSPYIEKFDEEEDDVPVVPIRQRPNPIGEDAPSADGPMQSSSSTDKPPPPSGSASAAVTTSAPEKPEAGNSSSSSTIDLTGDDLPEPSQSTSSLSPSEPLTPVLSPVNRSRRGRAQHSSQSVSTNVEQNLHESERSHTPPLPIPAAALASQAPVRQNNDAANSTQSTNSGPNGSTNSSRGAPWLQYATRAPWLSFDGRAPLTVRIARLRIARLRRERDQHELRRAHNEDQSEARNHFVEMLSSFQPEWVPILERDREAQRVARPPAPFSDAYLTGMPARKRRCLRQMRPAYTLQTLFSDSVHSSVELPTPRPAINARAFRDAFSDRVRELSHARAASDDDYDEGRYESASRFLDPSRNNKDTESSKDGESK